MSKTDELKTDDPEVLQSQMQASLSLLRAQIASYVQKEDKGKRFSEVENVAALQYTIARPDRLGVGAKFLSHNDAVRSDRILSKSDQALKNKMFKGQRFDHNPPRDSSLSSTRYRAAPTLTVADDSEEEESKFSTRACSSTQARPTAPARKFATTAKQVTDGYLNSQAKRPSPQSNTGEGTKKKKKKKKNNTISQ